MARQNRGDGLLCQSDLDDTHLAGTFGTAACGTAEFALVLHLLNHFSWRAQRRQVITGDHETGMELEGRRECSYDATWESWCDVE